MFNEKSFCSIPWSTLEIGTFGEFKICQFSGNVPSSEEKYEYYEKYTNCVDDDGNEMTIFTHTIQEALNSKYHKELRKAQQNGERHDHCLVCWDRDDAYERYGEESGSVRTYKSFIQLKPMENAITLDNVDQHASSDGYLDQMPISLDLRFTNICNMKCIMCYPYYSNSWYEDWIKLFGKSTFKAGKKVYEIKQENGVYKTDIEPWHDSERWFEQLDTIKHRIRHLYITGGEPFIVKGHEKLLDILIDAGVANKIVLEYDTNLSVINRRVLDKLKYFKKVELAISCDDIDERYEYIRFPGKFDSLLKNLELVQQYQNITVRNLSTCVGIYSVFSPIRLFQRFKLYNINIRFLTAPFDFDPKYIPSDLKKKIIAKYRRAAMPDRFKNFVIGFFENNMNVHSEEECTEYMKKFIIYMESLDKIRGTDWKAVFPDIAELLDEYISK